MQITLKTETGDNNELRYNANRLKRFSALTPSLVSINRNLAPERRRVEKFISSVFHESYGARISQHYPTLMSIRDSSDKILGALGFRQAGEEKLFLENYIDQSIETEISRIYGSGIARDGIIEIGNMASQGDGAAIFLIPALMAYLQQQGFSHVAFTATSGLYEYFQKIGVDPKVVAPADQSRLVDGGRSWGNYYDSMPQIVVGNVNFAADRLHRFLGVEISSPDGGLFPRIHPEIVTE